MPDQPYTDAQGNPVVDANGNPADTVNIFESGTGKPIPISLSAITPEQRQKVLSMQYGVPVPPGPVDRLAAIPGQVVDVEKKGWGLTGRAVADKASQIANWAAPQLMASVRADQAAGNTLKDRANAEYDNNLAAATTAQPVAPSNVVTFPKVQTSGQAQAVGSKPTAPPQPTSEERAIADIERQKNAAVDAATAAGQAKAAEEYSYKQAAIQKEQDLQAQQVAKQNAYDRLYDAQFAELKRAQDAMANGPDPGQWWASRSTGQKVVAGLGMLLGAFGQGDTNRAASIINDAVDQDIDRQKAMLGIRVAGATNLLAQMRLKFQDDTQALAATRALMWQNVDHQVDALASKSKSPELAAAAQQAKAMTAEQAAKAMADFKASATENALKHAQTVLSYAEANHANAQAAAAGGKGGKQMQEGPVAEVADLQTAQKALKDYSAFWDQRAGPLGGVAQAFPGTDATLINDKRRAVAEAIAKAEGRPNDDNVQRIYEDLPGPGAGRERKDLKIKNLNALLGSKALGRINAFKNTGYAAEGLAPPATEGVFKPK